jgi:hypothetical protein
MDRYIESPPTSPTLLFLFLHFLSRSVFTKCKESLQDGRRLENISWRLWYRELAAHTRTQHRLPSRPQEPLPHCPLTPVSEKGSSERPGKSSCHFHSIAPTDPYTDIAASPQSRIASCLPTLVPWPYRFPFLILFRYWVTTTNAIVGASASVATGWTLPTPSRQSLKVKSPPCGQDHMRYDPIQARPRVRKTPIRAR